MHQINGTNAAEANRVSNRVWQNLSEAKRRLTKRKRSTQAVAAAVCAASVQLAAKRAASVDLIAAGARLTFDDCEQVRADCTSRDKSRRLLRKFQSQAKMSLDLAQICGVKSRFLCTLELAKGTNKVRCKRCTCKKYFEGPTKSARVGAKCVTSRQLPPPPP